MTWLTDRAGDAAAIVAELGEPVTYTPKSTGIPVTVTAVVRLVRTTIQVPNDSKREVRYGHIRLLPTDAPAPDTRDLFTYPTSGGVQLAVTAILDRTWLVGFEVEEIVEQRMGGGRMRIKR